MGRTPTPPPNHNRRRGASTHDASSRVPYPPGETSDFAALTAKAVTMAEKVGGIHGFLLEMLEDCEAPPRPLRPVHGSNAAPLTSGSPQSVTG